jgi:two-component system, NarL family, invasion response regulator UvrY
MKVLLIEDHPIVREGCRRLLQVRPGLEVIEASNAAEGLSAAADAPDVVVLDLNLPDMRGLDLLTRLREVSPAARLIVFSMYEEPAFVARAMEAGALGYVTKNDDPECLLEAVDSVVVGRPYLARSVAMKLALGRFASAPVDTLSDRERRLVELLGAGRTLGEISADMAISYRTAAALAARTRGKLGLRTNAALIKFAVEQGRAP